MYVSKVKFVEFIAYSHLNKLHANSHFPLIIFPIHKFNVDIKWNKYLQSFVLTLQLYSFLEWIEK